MYNASPITGTIYRIALRMAFLIFRWGTAPPSCGGAENAVNAAPPVKLNDGFALASKDGADAEKLKPPDALGAAAVEAPKLNPLCGPAVPATSLLPLDAPKLNPAF